MEPIMSANSSSNPVAIITGASSGIGRATALALAKRGYVVALAARRVELLEQLAGECKRLSSQPAIVIPTDVASSQQVGAMVQTVMDQFGKIDVLVNNAGYGLFSMVHDTTDEQMRRIFDVNYFGLFYGCQAVAPIMMRQRAGHILNVSSVIGKRGTPFHGAYCATKFAIAGLTESMRVEMKPYNVRVTLVCPGLTQTEFFDQSGGATAKTSFAKFKKMMSAQAVGDKLASVIGKSRPEIVFTAGGKFLAVASALLPGMVDAMMGMYRNELMKNLKVGEK
jgi:short-subunit dehydrogenase